MSITLDHATSPPCSCADQPTQPGEERFDVAPDAAGGWRSWSDALARLLERLAPGSARCLVITQTSCDRYVQALIGHGRVRIEVSSNVYLPADAALSIDDERRLRTLGFAPPTRDNDHDGGTKQSVDNPPANWTRHVSGNWPHSALTISRVLVAVSNFDPSRPITLEHFPTDNPCPTCTWPQE